MLAKGCRGHAAHVLPPTPLAPNRTPTPPLTHLQAHGGGNGGVGQARHEARDANLGQHRKRRQDAQRLHDHSVRFTLGGKVGQQQRVAA